jgi:hypothetical protein
MAAIEKAEAEGRFAPGNYYEIPVRHDGWCDLLADRGPCNCDPVIGEPERVPAAEEN